MCVLRGLVHIPFHEGNDSEWARGSIFISISKSLMERVEDAYAHEKAESEIRW